MVTIRLARRDELQELTELWRVLMEMHVDYHPAFALSQNSRRQGFASLDRRLRDPWTRIYVCDTGDSLAGMLIAHYDHQDAFNRLNRRGYIAETVIKSDQRGKGYGKKLVETARDWLLALGVDFIELQVAPKNELGLAFWKTHGFTELTYHLARVP